MNKLTHTHSLSLFFLTSPVAATINAEPIVDYKGGVFIDETQSPDTNHIVSIVGWETDPESGNKAWIIRNSWGTYWGGTYPTTRNEFDDEIQRQTHTHVPVSYHLVRSVFSTPPAPPPPPLQRWVLCAYWRARICLALKRQWHG